MDPTRHGFWTAIGDFFGDVFNWRFEDFLHSPGTSPNPFFGLINERDLGLAPATP